ncbi:MAG: DUF748 domain-containing protein [Flavobacteriales bacterium]
MALFLNPRRKRIALTFLVIILLGLAIAAFLAPYLLKRYIEKNSEAWIDRRISIGSIVLNPFTGTYAVHDLVCYEPRSEQVFVSFNKLGVKGNLIDGFRNAHWRFRNAELREPYLRIVQRGDRFNFSDLLELGDDEEPEAVGDSASSDVLFSVEGIALSNGRIDYLSDLLREPLHAVDVGASCTRITSEEARMDFLVGLGLMDGTRLDGSFMIDTDLARYAVEAHLRDFDLAMSLPYLQDFFQAGSLAGELDLDFTVQQSYADSSGIAMSASMDLRGLALKDPQQEPLLDLHHLRAKLDTLEGEHFALSLVDIDGLDTRFALLADGTDNWTRLLKLVPDSMAEEQGAMVLDASESNYFVLFADYISYLGTAFTASDYTADSLVLRNGRLLYEDHSIPRSFRYELSEIDVRTQRFNAASAVAPVTMKARLNDIGSMEVRAEFDPNDFRNVDLLVRLDSVMLPHLDAYTRWYAAHPTEDGVLDYMSSSKIADGNIDSRNIIHVDRLKFGKKVDEHDPETFVLPLRLAAGLLKDAKGVVELDIPIKGDLKDPTFKVWPIVWQILKNLVVKAASAPANLLARAFEGADEKELESVRFQELQQQLEVPQRRALQQLAKALHAKPELRVDLIPLVDSLAESRELALFTAKGRYLFPSLPALSKNDSLQVKELATRDSSFVSWMDGQLPGTKDQPMTARSSTLVDGAANARAWQELEQARRAKVMQTLVEAGISTERLRFRQGTAGEVATLKGPPGYRFVFDVVD